MIKVRLQCSPVGTYAGPLDALKKTVGAEGLRALYKGAFLLSFVLPAM
jgi:solute carrier family 25 carnitine/acylcarnitine transporter 20/29